MILEATEEFLEHYGVKGQKWGVRRKSSGKSGGTDTSKLSNDDLRKLVDRMRLDQQYSELAKSTGGRKYAKSLLENSGRLAVGAVVTTLTARALGRVLPNNNQNSNAARAVSNAVRITKDNTRNISFT